LRGLSALTLHTYAYDLLCIYRWLRHSALTPERVTGEDLLNFLDYLCVHPPASPSLINARLRLFQRLIAFLTGQFPIIRAWQPLHAGANPRRYGFVRITQPRRVVRPLTEPEVTAFVSALHSWRDRAIVLLMFALGLRAREVLNILLLDLDLQHMTLLVHGKGNKERVLPLAPLVVNPILQYLHTERPATSSAFLFVVLKGPRRAQAMTYAGLRRIFRHYRLTTGIARANPHRFRHTFATNMIKARMALLILSKLMGHTSPQTTMRYVQVHDVELRDEYHHALANLTPDRPPPCPNP
jgi:site-specific recombinase XerD